MSSRSGVAMLLVLMTCTVLIVGATVIARTRTNSILSDQQALCGLRATRCLSVSHSAIITWLDEESTSVVIDPSKNTPAVAVLDDSFDVEGTTVLIRITAWDQQGMWPRNASELGLNPPGINGASFDHPPNLQQLQDAGMVFPTADRPDTIGGLWSTHNPWPTQSGRTRSQGTAAINVNTAPAPLLDQIMTQSDVGDLGALLQQRAAGEMATLSQSSRNAAGEELRLVSVSTVWAFRTQVTVGRIERAAWSVYANQGGQWRLVQRVMIDEPTN